MLVVGEEMNQVVDMVCFSNVGGVIQAWWDSLGFADFASVQHSVIVSLLCSVAAHVALLVFHEANHITSYPSF